MFEIGEFLQYLQFFGLFLLSTCCPVGIRLTNCSIHADTLFGCRKTVSCFGQAGQDVQ